MRPLYDARIEDLGPRNLVKVACQACAHIIRLAPIYLAIEPYQPVLSLRRRLRCTRCHTRGHVDIKIEWRG